MEAGTVITPVSVTRTKRSRAARSQGGDNDRRSKAGNTKGKTHKNDTNDVSYDNDAEMGDEEDSERNDDGTLYCICRQPWGERFMIGTCKSTSVYVLRFFLFISNCITSWPTVLFCITNTTTTTTTITITNEPDHDTVLYHTFACLYVRCTNIVIVCV